MTVVVGLHCNDGVVIGTDSAATFVSGNMHTIEQPTRKIHIINDRTIIAGTGAIGLSQRFFETVKNYDGRKIKTQSSVETAKEFSRLMITDMAYTGLKPGGFAALVAFCNTQGCHLCEFERSNFQPEFKMKDELFYVSMGSGQAISDPFLGFIRKIFWEEKPPDLQEGIFFVYWTLMHTINVSVGGIEEPIQICTLSKSHGSDYRAALLDKHELQEHRENVDAIEKHIAQYMDKANGEPETILELENSRN